MRRAILSAAVAVGVFGGVGAAAASAATTVVADHLARPRGLAVAPDGTLYASLLGNGGRPCNREGCFGASGRVVRVGRDGRLTTVASGLLTMRGRPDGFFSIGADQLTVLPDGRLATAVTAEFNINRTPPAAVPHPLRPQVGHVVLFEPGGGKQVGANIADVEYRLDPDGKGAVSNPYGITTLDGVIYVSDSAANDLLVVDGPDVGVLATFPDPVPNTDAVPDALAAGPDGALYVGEFTGGAQPRGAARIWRVVPGQPPTLFASGLTSITSLAFGPDGSLYATEFGPGDVVRIAPDGSRSVLAAGTLHFPGGIAVAPDGTVFVTNWTVASSTPATKGRLKGRTGQIVRIS
ncbi:ScyD/ScyE family protein [Baekduia soli]|uniref:ScyD/ScyE family protein n=1 Tax=Baekduia soli TaxID=496014 RepID=A0A5B8U639_9ACTN|nr:ScyD/ScyE family protein [Baekduia soli]QEC48586.1 ScyD/ScyE family protein [Baekduia soli]